MSDKEITPEQYAQMKKERLLYYEQEIPFLQKMKEYETLVTELDELEMRRVFAQVKTANLKGPQGEENPGVEDRKLRKDSI